MTYEEFKRLFDICCTIRPERGAEKFFIPFESFYEHYTDDDFILELEGFFDEETVEKAIKMLFEAA